MIKIHTDQNIADLLTKALITAANDEIQVSAVGLTYYFIQVFLNKQKRQKIGKSSDPAEEPKDKEEELSQEELQKNDENSSSARDEYDKERAIWVELKRLFEPDIDDELWKLQNHIHDLTWKLYDSCRVHHVSTEKGIDIYMLVEKEYPLSRGTLTQMLVAKLLVDQDNKMSREVLRRYSCRLKDQNR
ncbi:hypothetical protein Tco_0571536 [Tanacetum coccineum]